MLRWDMLIRHHGTGIAGSKASPTTLLGDIAERHCFIAERHCFLMASALSGLSFNTVVSQSVRVLTGPGIALFSSGN